MTKDVLVSVSGMQPDVDDDPVELVTIGNYYLKNGKHYVLYEEQPEEGIPVTKNVVKFYDGHFEITKKGAVNSFLNFDRGEKTSMVYNTPYGPLQMDVLTRELTITESEDELRVVVKYSLDINYQFVSECKVNFKIQARG
ncbi:MAG: DUF1934 domain-containing protein [Lachnospiraceae bacterium]|nr:DUF1934 domain-containing protein [Lachnospiraceae bacterium]